MLGQLHIKNIGIIEDITINFEDGLNIMTGETGSGKSLIIGSIGAVTGGRITKDMIKTGETSACIEACFFQGEEAIILSREIFASGRNICKIDGSMVTLAKLKEIGESLIDIHGQHDNQSLLNSKLHIDLLDKYIGDDIEKIKVEYRETLCEYRRKKKELETNFGEETERERKIDLLQYQADEIEKASLKVGEEEELNARRNLMIHSEKIATVLSNTYSNLNDIVVDNLGIATHELSGISTFNEKYDKILLNLNEAYYMLKDAASETLECMSDIDFDRDEQNQIEERLDLIYHLKKKYGRDIESVLKYYEDISNELVRLQNADEIIQHLKKEIINLENKLDALAIQMRQLRKEKSILICNKVNQELEDLEMKNAKIIFDFQEASTFQENGKDDVQMLITTNVGEMAKPLCKIASGGEISRIMLALKVVFYEIDAIDAMIFDEIDTGISGQAAKMVAEKMKKIGQKHQLICITHLPVIAAFGDTNFYISKMVKAERTCTEVQRLDEEDCIKEIARILDGNEISEISIEHARKLRKAKCGNVA